MIHEGGYISLLFYNQLESWEPKKKAINQKIWACKYVSKCVTNRIFYKNGLWKYAIPKAKFLRKISKVHWVFFLFLFFEREISSLIAYSFKEISLTENINQILIKDSKLGCHVQTSKSFITCARNNQSKYIWVFNTAFGSGIN